MTDGDVSLSFRCWATTPSAEEYPIDHNVQTVMIIKYNVVTNIMMMIMMMMRLGLAFQINVHFVNPFIF